MRGFARNGVISHAVSRSTYVPLPGALSMP